MAYGNDNLLFIRAAQFITFAGTSEQSAALDVNSYAIELVASADCWVSIGTNPTAAAPGAEATRSTTSFPVRSGIPYLVALPRTTDSAPLKVAVIQASAGGNLDIIERGEV